MEFNLNTVSPEQPQFNIDSGVAPSAPPSEEVTASRASKAHMGLGDILQQSYDDIYKNIAAGQESALRENAALEITNKAMQDRQQKLLDMAAQKGKNLTLEDVKAIDAPPADPKSVVEKSYSKAYMNTIHDAANRIEDTILDDAKAQDPAAVEAYMRGASDVLSKREYAITKAENAKAEADKNAWFGFNDTIMGTGQHNFGSYDLKQLASFGFYESVMLRGNTKDTSRLGFLGNVMKAQAEELLKLPFDEYQKEMDRITTNLSNSDPILAQQFAQAVAGMSTSERFAFNTTEAINAAMAATAFKGGRVVQAEVKASQMRNLGGLERGPDGVYRPSGGPTPQPPGSPGGALTGPRNLIEKDNTNLNRAAMAVQDVLRSSAAPVIDKSTIAAGAGDLAESGVQKTINSVKRNDPQADSVDTLLSISKTQEDNLRNNPGTLAREQHTRLLTASQSYQKNVVDVITNTSQPIRTPILAEDGFRGISENIKHYFPGRENTILDVDTKYDPIANVYVHDVKIGNYDGTAFTSYEQAAKHAEINGYPLRVEGKGGDILYVPAAAMRDFESVQTKEGEGTKFYVNGGIEVDSRLTPEVGDIPYDTKTGKFGKPVTASGAATVKQQGLGFYLIVSKPLNETESFVRDGLIGPDSSKSVSNKDTGAISSAANAIFGLIRNPYDTLSKVENENRAKVVFGQNRFNDLVANEIRAVEDIYKGVLGDGSYLVEKPLSYTRSVTGANKQVAQDFTRALVASQTMEDPKTGLPGYYMQTPAEIQHFWQANFGRPPSFKEQAAYLAVGRIDNFDHILRNIQQYMYKSRVGVEQWQFNTNKDGVRNSSGFFDARQVKVVNSSPDEVTLIVDANGNENYFHRMGTNAQTEFREAVKEGKYLGVELWDPESRPLKRTDVEGNPYRIRYVFSNAFERKPLTYDQVGYRGGGHWQYDYTHAVKAPIISVQLVGGKTQHIYEGDVTFGFVSNKSEGEAMAKNMNTLASLIRKKDVKAAKEFVKSNFDIPWKDISKLFRITKDPTTGEMLPPRFSTDPRQAFRVVPQGRTILQLDKELEKKYTRTDPKTDIVKSTFVDGTRHGSLARNFQTEYTQARDSYALNEFVNSGTQDKPFYQFRPAKLTDPITVMTRSMSRIVNSAFMTSQKIAAIEHWLQENLDLLDADINEIRSAPFYVFNEGKFKNNPDNLLRITNAKTNRYKIQQFIGTPSVIDSTIQGVIQELHDARTSIGEGASLTKKITRGSLIVPEWMLSRIHDPVDFGRAMAYHLNLGLFALKQVVVQSMAYTTIFGLAGPIAASAGSYAAMMYEWTRINRKERTVDYFDKMGTNFGWRLGEFSEATKLLEKTGFGLIRNELSFDTDNTRKQLFFRNDAKGILDAGQYPFHLGNLHVRLGAWYTAFREYRNKNPFTKIGPVQEGQILHRANILNSTMTRDANTILNKGLVGIPFQFFDYMKKMTDLFWGKNLGENFGKRLVQGEDGTYREVSDNTRLKRSYVRARMFLMYALLGGVSGAMGVTGLPINDFIRKKAIEGTLPAQTEAYVPGDKIFPTLMMEGPTSTLVAYLTGFGDPQKGTFYNFNNRFNPNGLQVLRDMLQTDASFWKILTGATGTTVGNELASLSGFTNAMYSMMEGDPAKEAWPLKHDDWLAVVKNASSMNDLDRLVFAISYGKWRDKHGVPVSDVSIPDAIFRTLTGLTDQNVDDMFLKTLTTKDRQALYNRAFKEFEEESRKAEQAAANGDKEQADDYNKRAFFALTSRNVPIELWGKAISRRAQMNRDKIEKNNEGYYLRYVPTNIQGKALEAYRKIQQKK